MQLGVIAILLSVLCLVAAFVFSVPSWINLVGIALGIAGLVMLGMRRKGGNG